MNSNEKNIITNQKIEKRNGGILNGILYSVESDICVIICHGFPGDKFEHGRFLRASEVLNENGYDSIIFDFSGYGDNEREPILISKQISDLEDVYNWVIERGYSKIATIGLSMGGLTSLLANLPKRNVAIFWAPGFFMKKLITPFGIILTKIISIFKKSPIKIKSAHEQKVLVEYTFIKEILGIDSIKELKDFNIPSLIVQGNIDFVVKPWHSKRAIKKMPQDENHKLVFVKFANHSFKGAKTEEFIEHSINWLDKIYR